MVPLVKNPQRAAGSNSNDVPTVVQLNAVFKADDVKHREKQIQEETKVT